ncbi:MAG: YeeE/YedE family protein [Moraxellaceae bacterium]|nr:YeeE/YedE family protein [Pseudomonadales bacterium]MCP5174994.1 YeeE/YedE family protein [Moraxellaceae bacterium]HQV22236.1 YeeE/YedE family protein [Agitococcus sp.]
MLLAKSTEKWIALVSGLVFGFGLIISEMINPAKVIAFLDVAGAWNPSLALVMAGAIAVALPAFGWAKKQKNSLCGTTIQLPSTKLIDTRLILGSMAFGAGWGLAGFCPAPALVAAAMGQWQALIFSGSMLVGFYLFAVIEKTKK